MRLPALTSVLFVAATLVASHASAHGIWVEKRRDNLEVVYAHGVQDDAYKTEKFYGAWGYDLAGKPVPVQVQRLDTHVRLLPNSAPATLLAVLDNGHFSQDPDGKWHNLRRAEVPGATQSMRIWKYNLSVMQPGAQLPELDQLRLAIVPQADPVALKAGESLPVQVLFDGKPLAGVKLVEDYRNMDHQASYETDAHGRAQVIVRNRGLNVLYVNYKHPLEDGSGINVLWMDSTLSFVASK